VTTAGDTTFPRVFLPGSAARARVANVTVQLIGWSSRPLRMHARPVLYKQQSTVAFRVGSSCSPFPEARLPQLGPWTTNLQRHPAGPGLECDRVGHLRSGPERFGFGWATRGCQAGGPQRGLFVQAARRLQPHGPPSASELERGVDRASAANMPGGGAAAAQTGFCGAVIVMRSPPGDESARRDGPRRRVFCMANTMTRPDLEAGGWRPRRQLSFIHPFDDPR